MKVYYVKACPTDTVLKYEAGSFSYVPSYKGGVLSLEEFVDELKVNDSDDYLPIVNKMEQFVRESSPYEYGMEMSFRSSML